MNGTSVIPRSQYPNVLSMVAKTVLDIADFFRLFAFHLYLYVEYVCRRVLFSKPKSLEGEIILVTGSGRGIGRYISLELATTGAIVVCWSKSPGPNEEVAKEIRKRGGKAYTYSVDVSNRLAVATAAELVRREVGDPTIVINNAGLMNISSFISQSDKEIENMFNVNVLSNFWVIKEFLPSMLAKNHGHLVSVCSASGILPTRNIAAYSSTKHAVHGLHDALRDEIRILKSNVKITVAYPFYCSTEMLSDGIPHTRFPLLFPIDPPEIVAKNILYGVRKDIEYIYTPRLVGWLAMFSWLVPPRAVDAYADFLRLNIDPAAPPQTTINGIH